MNSREDLFTTLSTPRRIEWLHISQNIKNLSVKMDQELKTKNYFTQFLAYLRNSRCIGLEKGTIQDIIGSYTPSQYEEIKTKFQIKPVSTNSSDTTKVLGLQDLIALSKAEEAKAFQDARKNQAALAQAAKIQEDLRLERLQRKELEKKYQATRV